MNKVVHCKRSPYDVYIGRPGPWGNPFTIGKDGDRGEVIEKYRAWIATQPDLLAQLHTLKGKTLGCWCSPNACHGDVLAELAEASLTTGEKVMKEVIRLIIAGGRDFDNFGMVVDAMQAYDEDPLTLTIVSGAARGADYLGEQYARLRGLPVDRYPAQWKVNGVFNKAAGYQRNATMAANATHLLAFWDGESRGTKHMIDLAKSKGLEVNVVLYANKSVKEES